TETRDGDVFSVNPHFERQGSTLCTVERPTHVRWTGLSCEYTSELTCGSLSENEAIGHSRRLRTIKHRGLGRVLTDGLRLDDVEKRWRQLGVSAPRERR